MAVGVVWHRVTPVGELGAEARKNTREKRESSSFDLARFALHETRGQFTTWTSVQLGKTSLAVGTGPSLRTALQTRLLTKRRG